MTSLACAQSACTVRTMVFDITDNVSGPSIYDKSDTAGGIRCSGSLFAVRSRAITRRIAQARGCTL